ncbi:MAG TPA: dTDP-4-dehydrorhamnose 3,5-epimerase family protein [Bacteroidales bacterium]|jgi:dTDP-4-dehydrorhamnose 3,5-epimerase-like enzyme|nr:dTDP-4-dehydrorhamnose 3,5-epimerase family protein [Bacteroidales bacterium]
MELHNMYNGPTLIKGATAVDDRGIIKFVNDFNFDGVKRFYIVKNHIAGLVRAWHGHKNEAKYVYAIAGSAIFGTVKIDNWENPNKDLVPNRVILSSETPMVYYVPAGYANGWESLTPEATLVFYSTATLEESKLDDYRYDSHYWDIWSVEQR